ASVCSNAAYANGARGGREAHGGPVGAAAGSHPRRLLPASGDRTGYNTQPVPNLFDDMFTAATLQAADKAGMYEELAGQARGLLPGESDRVANAANLAALVYPALPDLNWAGFYFYNGSELVVGPFQGKPACVRIALGKGVCGTAATTR